MSEPTPAGSVIITPSQMYGEIRVMGTKVDRLVAVVDPALSDIRMDVTTLGTALGEVRTELGVVRQSLARWRGVAAAALFVASAVLAVVGAYIQSGRL